MFEFSRILVGALPVERAMILATTSDTLELSPSRTTFWMFALLSVARSAASSWPDALRNTTRAPASYTYCMAADAASSSVALATTAVVPHAAPQLAGVKLAQTVAASACAVVVPPPKRVPPRVESDAT